MTVDRPLSFGDFGPPVSNAKVSAFAGEDSLEVLYHVALSSPLPIAAPQDQHSM